MAHYVIFGASGTIGSQLARGLVKRGDDLLLAGRDAEKLQALSEETGQPHTVLDFSQSPDAEANLVRHAETTGPFSGIVNCIGSVLLKPAHLTSDQEFRQTVETNLFTSFAAVRCGARLLKQKGGSIVLFASAAAEIGISNHEAIAAAKAGVIGLARSAAATYAPQNIRVNVISPGLIRTELTRRIWENAPAAAASTQMHALGRLGEVEHVTSLATWLLDPANNWITGQVIGIDGGLGHVLPRK